ncbi:hypothetical protein HHO41_15040 [Bacillus sp. DNRA2]|uniref:YciI family protein n=1 Tax=Bacillus TaxID=1386 RepID=UPI0011CAC093|nr:MULTISPECIES: YciI family protein [Bacillus]NMD71614.1 hypothetical protein [Bacillus sp. DNRA2]
MNKYLFITTRTEKFDPEQIPAHYEYLNRLKKENKLEMYGPFSDATGGAYIIRAGSFTEAQRIGQLDPLIKSGSSTIVVKEWMTK